MNKLQSRFRKTEAGPVIYSVGFDGIDDGGKRWRTGMNRGGGWDLVFEPETQTVKQPNP